MSDRFPRGEFPPERSREVKLDDQVAAAHVEALLDDICGHNGVCFSGTKPVKQTQYTKEKFNIPLVAGAWTERKKIFHGGSFLKLADDNMDIQNPEAQNRELSGF